jgi:hypothetical protein
MVGKRSEPRTEGSIAMSIRVPRGGTLSVPRGGTPRYSRMPEGILHEKRLTAYARLVYAELALWVFQGKTCSVGMRQIAAKLGISNTTVVESIHQLEALSLISVSRPERGKRTVYVLNSNVFGQKQGRATEVVSSPSGGKRLASVEQVA